MVLSVEKQDFLNTENKATKSMLFDYYGQLLNDRQNEIFRLYYEEDYSLSEIANELEISRQGVHDALKKAETSLRAYEEKLKLISKHEEYLTALKSIDEIAKALLKEETLAKISGSSDGKRIRKLLNEMTKTVGKLDV